jgi:hypothetical protein
MKNLTKNKHILFYEVMRKFNSTRNYYFIQTLGKPLNEKLNKIVKNSTVKIVQSNFPDSIFLINNCGNSLLKWIALSYKKIKRRKYDYIFGNFQIIKEKKLDVPF